MFKWLCRKEGVDLTATTRLNRLEYYFEFFGIDDGGRMKTTHQQRINYYELLGVDVKASPEAIRRAYLDKLKEWHPDKNPERLSDAEEATKTLNQAYHTLSDTGRRRQYDRMLRYTRPGDFRQGVNDQNFSNKMRNLSPLLRRFRDSITELYGLFVDAVNGRYRLHPATLGILGAGLLYFIIPTDFVPDIIPLVGFVDDLAVLSTVISVLQGELFEYRRWKQSTQGAVH